MLEQLSVLHAAQDGAQLVASSTIGCALLLAARTTGRCSGTVTPGALTRLERTFYPTEVGCSPDPFDQEP